MSAMEGTRVSTPGVVSSAALTASYVTGASRSGSLAGTEDYATIKYNSTGVQLWVQRYNGPGNNSDYATALSVNDSGNVYVTGYSPGGSGTGNDYATLKYNSSGVEEWVQRYHGPGNSSDYARSIAVDASGNVYVTGESFGSGSNYDYATIKYSQMVAIQPISNEIPNQFSLSQNYPNPFNPSTKINYELLNTNYVLLKVFDVLGNEVAVIVNEKQNAGSYQVDFDGSIFTSGVYFYKIEAGEFVETKRMLLLK